MIDGRLRVAVIADFLEEGWHSMDLVADMLIDRLEREHPETVAPTLVRPAMPRRLTRFGLRHQPRASVLDRALARQWDYPRIVARLPRFDVYHVVDHTYAHLAGGLPASRTLVTCHDVDAFRSILQPAAEPRSPAFRWMSRRILGGLRQAACVPCDSMATRDALASLAGVPADKLPVVPNGIDISAGADSDAAADFEAARLLGARRGVELLHVGSTIERKRIDLLLQVFAQVKAVRPDARLVRVGGPFTAEQRVLARELGVLDAIVVLPFVDRATLAAVYRRAAVALLPSEREGFGLPLVEALAAGTPVVASDIPVLREVGGDAAEYCDVGAIAAWAETIVRIADEAATAPRAARPPARSRPGARRRVQLVGLRGAAGRALPSGRRPPAAGAGGRRVKQVLHVGKFYPPVPGGMERVVQMLCHASHGLVESRVLAVNTGPETVEDVVDGVPVTRVGVAARAGSVPVAPAFAARLRRTRRGSDRPARAQPVGAVVVRDCRAARAAGHLVPQ